MSFQTVYIWCNRLWAQRRAKQICPVLNQSLQQRDVITFQRVEFVIRTVENMQLGEHRLPPMAVIKNCEHINSKHIKLTARNPRLKGDRRLGKCS